MKKHLLIKTLALALPIFGLTSFATANSLPAINNIYVPVHRVLESAEQRYILQVTTGVWNPKATLLDRISQQKTYFNGSQKGNTLSLYSVDQLPNGKETATHKITANLHLASGDLKSEIISNTDHKIVNFQPLVKIKNRPSFHFKFYGGATIQAVTVTDAKTQQIVQRLTGFHASPERMDYMDINFDGYYDLVFVNAAKVDQNIYWMYNPKTAQFQRAAQLEKLAGQIQLDGIKQQVSFGSQHFKVEQGILIPFTP